MVSALNQIRNYIANPDDGLSEVKITELNEMYDEIYQRLKLEIEQQEPELQVTLKEFCKSFGIEVE
jgi:hypothetical protein